MGDRTDKRPAVTRQTQRREGGYGGGGRATGFDGTWGRGYGGEVAPPEGEESLGGVEYGGGMAASDYERGPSGEEEFNSDDRSWIDRCADDECAGRTHHYRGRGPRGWTRSDRRLYEEVCERLLNDRLIDARGMEVDVEDGVVILRGEARAASDPALAERLVRETPGVRGVRLHLLVRPRAKPAPAISLRDDDLIDKNPLAHPILPT